MTWTARVRARRTAPRCARVARHRTARRARRAGARVARPAARQPARRARPRAADAWSTACPSSPAACRSTTRPTDEVKADQKAFFGLLYNLLVDADRGPRLPTLILALGADRVRGLLALARPPRTEAVGLCSPRRDGREQRVVRRGAGVAQEVASSGPTRRSRRSRGPRGRAARGSGGSRGWARAPTAPGRGPSSRCGAAGRAAVVADPRVGVDGHAGRRLSAAACGPRGPPTRPARPGGGVRRRRARSRRRARPARGRRAGGSAAGRPSGPRGSRNALSPQEC